MNKQWILKLSSSIVFTMVRYSNVDMVVMHNVKMTMYIMVVLEVDAQIACFLN